MTAAPAALSSATRRIWRRAQTLSQYAKLWHDRRGAAAVEFALLAPVLMLMLVTMTDLALAFFAQSQLSAAVATGAQYAYLYGQAPASTFVSDVGSVVSNATTLTPLTSTVTFNNRTDTSNASACYCPTGTARNLTWGSAVTCGSNCGAANEVTAGGYVLVSASYTFHPIFPADTVITGNTPITQSFLVRVH